MGHPLIDALTGFHDWTSQLTAAAFPFLNPQPFSPFESYSDFQPSELDISKLLSDAEAAGYQIPDYVLNTIQNNKNPFRQALMFGSTANDINNYRQQQDRRNTAQQLNTDYQTFINDPAYNKLKTLVEGWATTPFVNDQEVNDMVQHGITETGTAARKAREQGLNDLVSRGIGDSGIAASWENQINQTAEQAAGDYRVRLPQQMKEINRDRAASAVELANKMQTGRDAVGMQYNLAAKAALSGSPIPTIDFSGLTDTFGQVSESEANFNTMKRLVESGQADKAMQLLMQAIGMGGQISTSAMSSIIPMLGMIGGGGGGGGGGGSGTSFGVGIPGVASASF